MYLSTTIVLGYIATLGATYAIPQALSDGIYTAQYDASGKTVVYRIGDLIAGANEASQALETRAGISRATNPFNYYCGCGYNVPPDNCDSAVESLESKLGDGITIESQQAYFAVASNVVAFACNSFPRSYETSGQLFREAASSISGQCGSYTAGSQGDQGRFVMGYLQYSPGIPFCHNAATSPTSSC